MASLSRGYPIRALMDRDLHDGSAVYPSVLSRIGGSLSFLPVSRSINPPSPSPKRKRGRYRRQSRHFIALDASLVREIKRGGEKREKRKKKEQLVRTGVNDNCFLSRRWIVIRNEGKQVPPRLLLDRRELTAAIRARSSWREFPLKLGEFRRIEQ